MANWMGVASGLGGGASFAKCVQLISFQHISILYKYTARPVQILPWSVKFLGPTSAVEGGGALKRGMK